MERRFQTKEAARLAVWDALSKAFSEPFSIPGHGALRLPISIGTTSLAPGGVKADAERVKAALWSSLRKARETEGSSLVTYDEQLREERARHLRVEADIRQALDEDRVVAFLQPIVSAGSGAIEGFEALVRVRTPDGGLMPPGVFIPVVEPTDAHAGVTPSACRDPISVPSAETEPICHPRPNRG